jgi:AcrR family transcriptional regulator
MADALSRDSWTDAALDALVEGGVEAVRVERLAARLGVTKGSFYWHFRDRSALLEAMFERWERVATQAIIDEVEGAPGPAESRLRALFSIAQQKSRMALETALREWARREPRAQRAVARVDDRRMRYLGALFEELGVTPDDARARSFLAYSALFGGHFIAARGTSLRGGDLLDRCAGLLIPPRTPVY